MEKLTICRCCGRTSQSDLAFCSWCGAPLDFLQDASPSGFSGAVRRLAFELWRLESELDAFLEEEGEMDKRAKERDLPRVIEK